MMLVDVVEAEALPGWRLWLRFEDGAVGEVEFRDIVPFEGVFAPLRDAALFAAVRVDREAGTVVWPNGADLDPDVLHAHITGRPLDLGTAPIQRSA